jgi:tetratricopeptide (TPR) repeat protein
MRGPRTHAAVALSVALALAVSCSTAPKKSDSVTAMKTQASQDGAYGESYFRQGRYDLALQFFLQSLSEYTSVDDAEGIIQSYNSIGKTYMATGSLDSAQEIFLKARDRARGTSGPLLFVTTNNLGELYLARGDGESALGTFEEALAMPAAARTSVQTGILYHNLGTAQKFLGNPEKALDYYGQSLKINLENKHTEEAASDYYMIASVHSKQGALEEAAKNAELALTLDKQIESSPGIAKDLYALGLIANKRKDAAAAYDYFQRSYLVFTTLGMRSDMKKALTELVAAADALGRITDAAGFRATLADLEKQ